MRIKLHHRLSFQQAKYGVFIAFILGVSFSLFQIYLDFHKERSSFHETVHQVLLTVKSSATQATYTLDKELAREVVKGLLAYSPIVKASILDDQGNALAFLKKPKDEVILHQKLRSFLGDFENFKVPLYLEINKKTLIGEIHIQVDNYSSSTHFLQRSIITIFGGLLRNLLLAICFIFVFNKITTKPLFVMAASLPEINPQTPEQSRIILPKGHEHDELGLLVTHINQTLERIETNTISLHKTEAALEEQILFINTLTNAIPNPIFYKNIEGQFIGCNYAFETLIGKSINEIQGKTVFDIFPAEMAELYHKKDLEVLDSQQAQLYESIILDKDQQIHNALFHKAVFYKDKEIAGTVATLIDISQRKEVEKALRERLRYEEELAECSKTLFFSDDAFALDSALHHLLKASSASRVYIFQNFNDHLKLETQVKKSTNTPSVPSVIPKEGLPENLKKTVSQGQIYEYHQVQDHPDTYILKQYQIQSLLIFPIILDGKLWGFIGFDDCTQVRAWKKEDIRILRT
ncbi:MAG: PAS domain S-box-containing protein, partial [bacterium]